MGQPFDILTSKTSPPQTGVVLLRRPRLGGVIREAETRTLLVLSADAGYGKTSLLLAALPDLSMPVAWLSLDQTDVDPNILCADIVAAIRRVLPDFGEDVLKVLTTGPSPAILLSRLLHALDAAAPIVLVLDDFHVLDGSPVAQEFVDHVLAALPASAHLIIATRTQPRLPAVPRLLVEGRALVVRREHLAFTPEETAAFLRDSHGLGVGAEDAHRLADRTEGWAAALQLVALAIKHRSPTALEGTPREVFDYLAAAVVGSLPDGTREFLMRTSILTEFWPSLCRALVDDVEPEAVLAELERANLFVYRLDEAGTRFRYHQLFAEYLQRQLALRGRDQLRALHHRAAAQLESEGIPEQAVRHYIAADSYEDAERVMKPIHGARLTAREAYVFRDLIGRLPDAVQARYPWMARSGASACRYVGDYEGALRFARRAMDAAEERDPNLWAFSVHGTGVMYVHMDRYHDAVEITSSALARLESSGDLGQIEPRMLAGILSVQVASHLQLGDLPEAERMLQRLGGIPAMGTRLGRGIGSEHHAGVIAAFRFEYARAIDHFAAALRAEQERGSLTFQTYALTEMAAVEIARGSGPVAQAALRRAVEAHARSGERATDLQLTHLRGDACLMAGDLAAADRAYQETLAKCRDGESAEPRIWAIAGLAGVARARGNTAQAESLLSDALQVSGHIHLGKVRPRLLLTRAVVLAELGHADAALTCVREARDVLAGWQSTVGLSYCGLLETAIAGAAGIARGSLARILREAAGVAADLVPLIGGGAPLVIPVVVRALQDETAPDAAATLLTAVGTPAVPALLEALQRSPQESLVRALGRIGDPRARRPLLRIAGRISALRLSVGAALAKLRAPEPVRLRICLFGPFEVLRDNGRISEVEWRTQKVKTLLKYLLLHRHRLVPRDELIEVLWPGSDPTTGRTSLKTAVKTLRQALEPLLEGSRSTFIAREGSLLRFTGGDRCWLDVDEYDRLLALARREETAGRVAEAVATFEQACALYRGELLDDDRYEDWPAVERERRREMHLDALQSLAALHAARRDYRRALEAVHHVLALDRLREAAYRQLMSYALARGDREAALRAYQTCEQLLREELGVTPQPETRALYDQARSPAAV